MSDTAAKSFEHMIESNCEQIGKNSSKQSLREPLVTKTCIVSKLSSFNENISSTLQTSERELVFIPYKATFDFPIAPISSSKYFMEPFISEETQL